MQERHKKLNVCEHASFNAVNIKPQEVRARSRCTICWLDCSFDLSILKLFCFLDFAEDRDQRLLAKTSNRPCRPDVPVDGRQPIFFCELKSIVQSYLVTPSAEGSDNRTKVSFIA